MNIISCWTYYQQKTLFYSFSMTIKDNMTLENQCFVHVLKSGTFVATAVSGSIVIMLHRVVA